MKLSVEIAEGKFSYSYEVGDSKSDGERPLSADGLINFTNLLELARGYSKREREERWEEAFRRGVIEEFKRQQEKP